MDELKPVVIYPPRGPSSISATVSITEKRAPTDESVRLLREMEQKARDEVLQSIKVGNTVFECIVQQVVDCFNDQVRMQAAFSLNGKKMKAEFCMWTHEARENRMKLINGLRDEMGRVIATEVLLDGLRGLEAWGP